MKKLGLLVMPLMTISLLASCGKSTSTVTWENYDGKVLEIDENVPYGTIPTYDGFTPTRDADTQYYYVFNGWNPVVHKVYGGNITYTATYQATDITGLAAYIKITVSDSDKTFGFTYNDEATDVAVDWGDGANNANKSHTYDSRGTYSVKIKGTNITNIAITENEGEAYVNEVYLGKSITSIGDSAFYNCSSLTFISIPNGVTSIESCAFKGCSSLASINIPDSVTLIGNLAFAECSSLTFVSIPDSVTSIGDLAFRGCSSLAFVSIPDSVTSIGYSVFLDCSKLRYNEKDNGLYLGNSVNNYLVLVKAKDVSISSCTIDASCRFILDMSFLDCSSLTSIVVPDTVISIGKRAFTGCSSLASVNIPNGITSIELDTFKGCSSLLSVNIPNSVTSIGDKAFYDCLSLTSVNIPNSVTSIAALAFGGCAYLVEVDLTKFTDKDEIPFCNEMAFDRCDRVVFEVASVDIANKFKDSGRGWPNILDAYHWPGKSSGLN